MRTATICRETAETKISLSLDLDGSGRGEIDTGVGFLDHMLTLLARHARFDLTARCDGDTHVDGHHSVEDVGICLGKALREALGEKRGVCRYASCALPMDEALILAAVDLSGRGYCESGLSFASEKIGSFDTELIAEFFTAFALNAGITLHLTQLSGKNSHHIAEAAFKAAARALRAAVAIDPEAPGDVPSTKGVLE